MHMGTQITTHNAVQSRITRGHTKYSHTETEYVENCAAHATYISHNITEIENKGRELRCCFSAILFRMFEVVSQCCQQPQLMKVILAFPKKGARYPSIHCDEVTEHRKTRTPKT